MSLTQLGLGGGCHWCTEAIFSSLKGMNKVEQGWLAASAPNDTLSEGVLLEFDQDLISLQDLITIHIETHSASAQHSMRGKYRSAVYAKDPALQLSVSSLISHLNEHLSNPVITQTLDLVQFKPQPNESYQNYFYKRPDKPFCQAYISPKLEQLLLHHSQHIDEDKIPLLNQITAY